MMTEGFPIMSTLPEGAETPSACQQYPTLLAVSAAIIAHRDLGALFHELADRLHQVVRFDYLACLLHDVTWAALVQLPKGCRHSLPGFMRPFRKNSCLRYP
jgi:hypothetical protein